MTNRLFARIGLGIAFSTVLVTAVTVPASGAPVAAHTAVVKGQVFADANSNVHADHGEGLRGAALKLSNFSTNKTYRITTGVKGRFRTVVPTGNYYLSGEKVRPKVRWTVIPKSFRLHADGKALSLRAVKPLGKALKAEMHFAQDRYGPHDRVHVVVTLTNAGSKVLRGIGAECDHVGDPYELFNRGPGWGKLAFDGPGVSLAAHATRTFDVHDTVPASAQRAGEVEVECDFGYRAVDEGHRPSGYDTARVPGQVGVVFGNVGHYRPGHPNHLIGLAHARVVIVNLDTCPLYTRRTKTDADGHYRIAHAPAGQNYQLYVNPPAGWKVRYGNPVHTFVEGRDAFRDDIEVVRGHKHVPSPPTTCS